MKKTLKKVGKILKYVSLAIVLIFAVVVFYLGVIVRDIQPIDDSDMEIVMKDVPDNENAYPLLWLTQVTIAGLPDTELFNRISQLSEKLKQEKPLSDKTIEEAMFLYKEKLETIDRIAKMKYSKGTLVFKPEDRIPNFLSLREFARLKLALAEREFAAGNTGELLETGLDMAQFGRLVQQNEGGTSLISLMIGISIKEASLAATNEYLDAGYFPAESQKVIASLEELYESDDSWVNVWKGEYKMLRHVLNQYDSYRMKPDGYLVTDFGMPNNVFSRAMLSLVFRTERTKKRVYDFDKAMIKYAKVKNCSELDRKRIEEMIPRVDPFSFKTISDLARGKFGTDLFLAIAIPNFIRAHEKKFYMDTMTDFTRIRIAALQYSKDKGELPESLGALAPEYISEIPFDRFDGKPIRYDRDRKIIYSAGLNFTDDGGKFDFTMDEKTSWNDLREQKDLAMRIMK